MRPTPTPPPLVAGEVHVWRIALDPAHALRGHWSILSPVEEERARRLRSDDDRTRYVASHSAMRKVLAAYTGSAPRSLALVEGAFGKPSLDPANGLEFNLSHSHELGLLAVSRERAVGVDVVRHDEAADHAGIAHRTFSPAELEALGASRGSSVAAFYRMWARKEAFLKATGHGLTRAREVAADPGQWTTFDLDVGDGYSAAVVVANPAGAVSLFDFAGS